MRLINPEREVRWDFWVWWVWASSVGLVLGLLAIWIMVAAATTFKPLGFEVKAATGIGAAVGAVFGASVGNAQRLVLRKKVSWSERWVFPSAVGGGMGVGIIVVFAKILELDWWIIEQPPVGTVFVAVVGASLGIAQWLILRQQVARAGWWVLASTMGILVFNVVGLVRNLDVRNLEGSVVRLVVTVAGYGAITGGVLFWLLRQPAVKELDPS